MTFDIVLPLLLKLTRTWLVAVLAMFIVTGCSSIPVAQSKSVPTLSKNHDLPTPSVSAPLPPPTLMNTFIEKLNVNNENKLADGAKYTGDLLEGKKSGRGVYTWPDGAKYEGSWVNDRRNGQGSWTSASGDRYDGTWVNDQRTGYGVYSYVDGRRYEGEFVNDKPSGLGISTDHRGMTYHQFRQGVYLDDAPPFVSIPFGPTVTKTAINCKNIPDDWLMIDGKCGSDGPEGAVQWVHKNGLSEYHGVFKSGNPSGEMTQTVISRDMAGKDFVTLLKGKSNSPGEFASAQVNQLELIDNKPVWSGYFRGAMKGHSPNGNGNCFFHGKWETCELRDGQRVDRIHTARVAAEREKQLKAERARQAEAQKAAQLQKAEEARLERVRQAEIRKAVQIQKAEEARQERVRQVEAMKAAKLQKAEAAKLEKARQAEERRRLAEATRIQNEERKRQLQAEKVQRAEAKKAAQLQKSEEARLEKARKNIAKLQTTSSGYESPPQVQATARGTQSTVVDKAVEAVARQPLIKACERVLSECNRVQWPLNEGCKSAANNSYPCNEAYR